MNGNGAIELSGAERRDKARSDHFLAETLKILRQLESERRKTERRRHPAPNIISEVKSILHGAA